MTDDTSALLGIYLNDHLAGATLGAEMSSRMARAHRMSPEGPALERLATEIAEDRSALLEMLERLGVPARRYKIALGWAAEKAGRFKPNGRVFERSPLSNLEEIETLCLGVNGKGACWRTLRVLSDRDDRLDSGRLDDLLARAGRQADTLEKMRVRITADLVASV